MYSDTFITIEQGKEYQARNESIYQGDSFFAVCYRQAANCLQEILAAGQGFEPGYRNLDQQEIEYLSSPSANINRKLLGYPNNIIAFCAERGQGKTSAMVSFATALKDMHCNPEAKEKLDFWGGSEALKYHFSVVDRIDPTTMEEKESIVKMVLSRMFNQFQVEWERRMEAAERSFHCEKEHWQTMRRNILKEFQKCYRSLQIIEDRSIGQAADLLEQMVELGDSYNLRGALYLLIKHFLRFMCPGRGKEACLVIQIDDADFNIERAYNIIDDIRRYLVLPRVVVLLAANMTQLETTVEQHFIEQYSRSIQNCGMASVERCHDIAERYISKVIPGYRRIFLPDLQKFLASQYEHIQVKYQRSAKSTETSKSNDPSNSNILEEKDSQELLHYQDQLLRFLYQRTGLIFLKPERFLHNLLPGNMRELTHFLAFFNRLDKLDITYFTLVDYFSGKCTFEDGKIDAWRNNLSKLEYYLLEMWAPINLRTEGHALLRNLQSDPDDNKNWNLLRLLPDYYGRECVQSSRIKGQNWAEYREQFKEVCRSHGLSIYDTTSPAGGSVHASYADVCEALNVLSTLPENNRHYKLIYAIHLFYTIRLNQLLLDQVERSTSPELPKDDMLAMFLSDVLFKRKDLKEEPRGYAFWQYEVCASDLQKLFRPDTQRDISYISAFCRSLECVSHIYVTKPITMEELKESSFGTKTLQFNYFYSNLQDIDTLTSYSDTTKKQFRDEDYRRNKMAGSFALLLNWDVQYEFFRNLRYHWVQSPDILQNMHGVYEGRPTRELLSKISRLTDLPDYEGIFQFYTNYETLVEFSASIQSIVPEIKRNVLPPMIEGLDELRSWLNKIKAENQYGGTLEEIYNRMETQDQRNAIHGRINDFTVLQSNIQPFLSLRKEDQAAKEEDPIFNWTLEKVCATLDDYATRLNNEMNQKDDSHNAEESGEEG